MILKPYLDLGWRRIRGGRVLHYFRDGKSLCGRQRAKDVPRRYWAEARPRCGKCLSIYDAAIKQEDPRGPEQSK